MKCRNFLVLFLLLVNTVYAENNDWLGEWKINDKDKYMSFTIKDSGKSGLIFSYDEGVGINGVQINGIVKLGKNSKGVVNASIRGTQCLLKLQYSKNKNISLSNCELDSYDDSSGEKVFVPRSTTLYYKASFNCAKAETKIERAICDSKIIAKADKELGSIYKSLRKKLSKKNVKRLKNDQRSWIKRRDDQCENNSSMTLNYCLRHYYGQRLFSLNLLNNYSVWNNDDLTYSVIHALSEAKQKSKLHSRFNEMDSGLGLWLAGKIKRRLTDTGSYEVEKIFTGNSYIFSGPYTSNPTEGYDPQSFGNEIFIEFSASRGTWLGLVNSGKKYIYIPNGKTISNVSEKFKLWMKDFDEPEIVNVF